MWIAQFISLTGSQMQVVAIHWHVYLLTRSPLALGLVGLTRVLPIVGFSLWGGIVADRHDRRRVMLQTQLAMTLVALGLGGITLAHRDTLWLLYTLNALSAAAVAFDGHARQALVPRLVPREDLPGALSLNLTIFHASMICGPALAGLVIAGSGAVLGGGLPEPPVPGTGGAMSHGTPGLALIYGLNALSFLAVLASLLAMRPETGKVIAESGSHEHPLVALRTGLRFVFTTPLMVWTMALDFFATFFSGAMSLLPIFADQILRVGPDGYGLLVAAPAVGAIVGSIYTSLWSLPRRQGRVFLWAVAAYGLATIAYGLSRSYLLSLLALAGTGLADLVSTVIRQTLRQLITPDALRGRMTSINMIFFMGGPQLGEVEAGLLASLFASAALGARVSVVSGGLATLLVVIVIGTATRIVRSYDVTTHLRAD